MLTSVASAKPESDADALSEYSTPDAAKNWLMNGQVIDAPAVIVNMLLLSAVHVR